MIFFVRQIIYDWQKKANEVGDVEWRKDRANVDCYVDFKVVQHQNINLHVS